MSDQEEILERRARALASQAAARRVGKLPGDGLGIARRIAAELLASGDASCGVMHHEHEYGGSVPEGVRFVRRVVLPDALIEAESYDSGGETYLYIWASTEARADELEAFVHDSADKELNS